jgi:branched-chain amino acid transport system substrate-binding protein
MAVLLLGTMFLLGGLVWPLSRAARVARPMPPAAVNIDSAHERDRRVAREAYARREWAQAVEMLDRITTAWPQDAEAHILKENAYVRLIGGPAIVVPYIGSQSGAEESESVPHLYGLALAQSSINATGGIGGRKLIMELYDDQSSTARCLEIAEAVLRDPQVFAVIGPSTSQKTLAVAPLFNAAHVSLLPPTASCREVWESGAYVLGVTDSRDGRVRAQAAYVASHFQVVGLVGDASSRVTQEIEQSYRDQLERAGVKVLDLPAASGDCAALVAAVRSQHAQAVIMADWHASALCEVADAMRAAGLRQPIFSQALPHHPQLRESSDAALDGVYLSDFFAPESSRPQTASFVRGFARFGNVAPNYLAANSYDAVMALADGLRQASSREALNVCLRASGTTRPPYQGVSGPFALGRKLDGRPVSIFEISGGRMRTLAAGR